MVKRVAASKLRKLPLARFMTNESDVPQSDIGSLNQQCIHCQAFHFADERKLRIFNLLQEWQSSDGSQPDTATRTEYLAKFLCRQYDRSQKFYGTYQTIQQCNGICFH